jgi:phosphatidylinositol 4-phosphatase
MRRFFDKVTKKPGSPSKTRFLPESPPPVPHSALPHHPTGLQPSYAVPPLPHPYPHEHIAIIASKGGLLLRPHLPGLDHPASHVRISWGKTMSIEEVEGESDVDWSESVVVYGIIGTLGLFTGGLHDH